MSAIASAVTASQRRAAELFLRGGCVRRPNADRRPEGHRIYKKGWEVRFYAGTRAEAIEAEKILERAGLQPGRPYRKRPTLWILPVYGREQVERFLAWVDEVE